MARADRPEVDDGCGSVRQAVRAGLEAQPALEPAVLDHAASCPPCAALLADGAALGRSLVRGEQAAADLGPDLLAGVEEALARDARSPLGWLRARPTGFRRLVVLLSVLPLVLWHVRHFGWRADLEVYPALRLALTLGAFGLLALRNAWVALRPPHEAPEPPGRAWLFVGLALLASLLAAAWPAPYPMSPTLCWGSEEDMALGCFTWGVALGLPLVVTTVILNRLNSAASLALSAASAGLVGGLVLAAQCPHVDPAHLLVGHLTILVALLAGGLLASAARRRWLDR